MKTVRGVAFSPDGTRAVSGGNDTIVRIWDLEKGIDVRHLIGHKASVNAVAWLPDGRTVVSGDHRARIKLWNADTGQELGSLRAASDVRDLAVVGDGDLIVSGSRAPGKGNAFSSGRVRPIWRHKTLVTCIAFSHDGRLLLANEWDGAIRIWEVESGELIERLPGFPDATVGGFARFRLTPDDAFLVSTGKEIRIWRMDRRHRGTLAADGWKPRGHRSARTTHPVRRWKEHSAVEAGGRPQLRKGDPGAIDLRRSDAVCP